MIRIGRVWGPRVGRSEVPSSIRNINQDSERKVDVEAVRTGTKHAHWRVVWYN